MANRVSANEVRLIAAQTAAASAATAAAVAEQMAQSRERQRQECQVKASQEIPNFLRGIEASARLGMGEVFFAAIEEDDDMYWNYVAEDLRTLGYEVDIGFLEERRRFRNPQTERYEDRTQTRHHLRLIDVDYQQFRNDVGQVVPDIMSCCGYCRRYKLDEYGSRRSRRLSRDVQGISIWDTDGFLFGILEILWVLTIIGPIFGACRRFGCCSIVCDSARTKMTCKAPYITGFFDYWRHLNPGAIWYVRVSWQNLETTSAATATVRPEGIPIAIPIDGIGPGSIGTGQEGFVPVKPAEITYVSPSAR